MQVGDELFYIQPVDGEPGQYTLERTDAGEPWTFDLSFVCSADPFMVRPPTEGKKREGEREEKREGE